MGKTLAFYYFLPGVNRDQITKSVIVNAGLGEVLRDRLTLADLNGEGNLALAAVVKGPEGHSGTILIGKPASPANNSNNLGDDEALIGYYPARQTWVKSAAGYWIGWETDKLPTADDLVRDKPVDGYEVMLGPDDNPQPWLCPVIRLALGECGLPDVWSLEAGKVVSRVRPDWQWAWDLSGKIWDWYSQSQSIPKEQAFLWAAKLLGINYRVGPDEVGILQLIGRDAYDEILCAAINGPLVERWREAQKKSDSQPTAELTSSSAG